MSAHPGEDTLVRFLLEDLSEPERASLEDRYFSDDELFARLLAVEGELIEDYLGGRLDEHQRRRFETAYLGSAVRRSRFELSRRLMQSLAQRQEPVAVRGTRTFLVPPRRRMLALGAAVALALFSLLAADDLRLRGELERTRAQLAAAQQQAQERERQLAGQRPPEPRPAPRMVALNLRAGLVRNPGEGAELAIGADVSVIRATLEPPAVRYPAYRATLRTAEGRPVWKGQPEPGRAGPEDALVVFIPAPLLGADDYVLVLEGVTAGGGGQAVAEYIFRVLPPS